MPAVPRRFGYHENGFGALRLLFAALVIVSHATVLVDGDDHREILARIFGGPLLIGSVAVIGFFIISGYLVTGSLLNSRTAAAYLVKRIARIYPAYLVAFALTILVVAPLAGALPPASPADIAKRLFDALALQPPWAPGAFKGSHGSALNGSMWTISYEFRCYLILPLLGFAGVLRRRRLVFAMTAILLVLTIVFPMKPITAWVPLQVGRLTTPLAYALGEPHRDIRLVGAFLTGTCFYLYRDRLRFMPTTIVLAAIALIAGLMVPSISVATTTAFGGFLVFAAAGRASWLYRINNENDISYGVYLYAWPITKLLNWWWPSMHPLAIGLLTLAAACICGWASWLAIEKPVMTFVRRRAPPDALAATYMRDRAAWRSARLGLRLCQERSDAGA